MFLVVEIGKPSPGKPASYQGQTLTTVAILWKGGLPREILAVATTKLPTNQPPRPARRPPTCLFVQQLIEGFAPVEIAGLMDFSTLQNHSGNYITPLFEEKFEDVVWSTKAAILMNNWAWCRHR